MPLLSIYSLALEQDLEFGHGLVQAVGSREDVELVQDGAPAESLVLLVDQQSLGRGRCRGALPLTGLLHASACSGPPRRRACGVFRLEQGPGQCPRAHPHGLSCPVLLVLRVGPPWTPRSCQVPSALGSRLACQALLVFILPALPGCSHLQSWEVGDAADGLEPHSSALLGVPALTYKPSRPLPNPPLPRRGGSPLQSNGGGHRYLTPAPLCPQSSSGCGGREGELTFTVRGRSRVRASFSVGHEGRWETDTLGSGIESPAVSLGSDTC